MDGQCNLSGGSPHNPTSFHRECKPKYWNGEGKAESGPKIGSKAGSSPSGIISITSKFKIPRKSLKKQLTMASFKFLML